jgi:carboxypeptidase C (cathepsin A)
MFSFNGGPGAAALWVNLGAFGPKKVHADDEGRPYPPPGRLVDNPYSVLDATDLVFIDPVSTGFSRPAEDADHKEFHGLKADVESVGAFIRLWLTRNERWASPKFIAGESYGTTRAAGLAHHLQSRYGMYLNGIVMISSILNFQNQAFHTGNDMAYIIHLPTYAATAWYHGRLGPDLSGDLETLLEEVEQFAVTDYALALLQGDALPDAERRRIAETLARYTGLSADYVERTDLRIKIWRFTKELLRDEGRTVGRLDSRFTGRDRDAAGESPEFDPSMVAVSIGYETLMNDYVRRELGFETDRVYESLSRKVRPWTWENHENRYVNVAEDLRRAMVRNQSLRVLFACGYYDFATPYFDTEYTVSHLGLPAELRDNVAIEHYEAGHMMYIRTVDHAKFKRDVVRLIEQTTREPAPTTAGGGAAGPTQ